MAPLLETGQTDPMISLNACRGFTTGANFPRLDLLFQHNHIYQWDSLVNSGCDWYMTIHSHKILPIQEGYPRGMRIPPLALTGFYSGRMAVVHLLYLLDIPCEVCKGLTKCWGSKVHLVVSSKFYESVVFSYMHLVIGHTITRSSPTTFTCYSGTFIWHFAPVTLHDNDQLHYFVFSSFMCKCLVLKFKHSLYTLTTVNLLQNNNWTKQLPRLELNFFMTWIHFMDLL